MVVVGGVVVVDVFVAAVVSPIYLFRPSIW